MPVPTTCTWFRMVLRWKSSLPYCVLGYPSTFRSASPLSTNSLFLYFLKLVCVLSSPLMPLFYFSSVLLLIIDKRLFLFDEFCFGSRSASLCWDAYRDRMFYWSYWLNVLVVFGWGLHRISLAVSWLWFWMSELELLLLLTGSLAFTLKELILGLNGGVCFTFSSLTAWLMAWFTSCLARVLCPH